MAQELRIKFYKLMIRLHTFNKKPMALFRDWEAIYKTRGMDKDEQASNEALSHAVLFLCLSAHDNEQFDMLHRLKMEKRLESLPTFKCV